MYEEILRRIDYVPVYEDELNRIFSVDRDGREVTLEEYLERLEPDGVVISALDDEQPVVPPGAPGSIRSQMDNNEITRLVEQYLESMPQDEVMAIVGEGTYTVDELRAEFYKRTAVGERLAEMVMDGHMFIREAAKSGKVRKVTTEKA